MESVEKKETKKRGRKKKTEDKIIIPATPITTGALLTMHGMYGTGKMLRQRLNSNYGPWGGYDAVMAEVDRLKGIMVKPD